MIKLLTHAGVQVSQSGDGAFIQAIKEQDHELLAHLIQHGGDAEFGDGDAILVAKDLYDIDSLRLLAKRIHNPEVYSKTFTKVTSKRERWQNSRGFLEFAKVLLNGGASGTAVDQALIEAFASDEAYIADQFACALPEPASININSHDGRALQAAIINNRINFVKVLLNSLPSKKGLSSAFMSIFESKDYEESLVGMVKLFLSHLPEWRNTYFVQGDPHDGPLYRTLHNHANKPKLLRTLLENGMTTDLCFQWELNSACGVESVSPLIWCLCQDDRGVDQRTLGILLRDCGK